MNSGQLTDGTVEAVRDLYAQLLTAWNDRDADRFGALFATDGASVGFDGSESHGPQIAEHLKPIFADHPTAAYVAQVRQGARRGRAAGGALAHRGGGAPGPGPRQPLRDTVHTL